MRELLIKDLLTKVFAECDKLDYVVVKLPHEFPNLNVGSDIDVICANRFEFAEIVFVSCVDFDLRCKVIDRTGSTYVDLYHENIFLLRFDLISELGMHTNVRLKDTYVTALIYGFQKIKVADIELKVPEKIFELIFRYVEYLELYSYRPDKIKHLNYIENLITVDPKLQEKFFQTFHNFIEIPKKVPEKKIFKIKRELQYPLRKFREHLQVHGLKLTVIAVLKKIVR